MMKWSHSWLAATIAVSGCVLWAPTAQAQSSVNSSADSSQTADVDNEKAVLEFVKEHQPELAELLRFLKSKKPKDYKEAMRESRKVRDRLLGIKDRDSELYDVELSLWKNSSQIRLLVASVSAKSNQLGKDERARLEELLKHENELSITRLKLEKARLESRVNQVTQQLERREEQAESILAKSLKSWEARLERSSNKK